MPDDLNFCIITQRWPHLLITTILWWLTDTWRSIQRTRATNWATASIIDWLTVEAVDLFSETFSGYKTVVTHLYCIFMSYFFAVTRARGSSVADQRKSGSVSNRYPMGSESSGTTMSKSLSFWSKSQRCVWKICRGRGRSRTYFRTLHNLCASTGPGHSLLRTSMMLVEHLEMHGNESDVALWRIAIQFLWLCIFCTSR